eukprot:GHVU01182639.1.p1 GENE.GHVU01182639.1~~GHVU01182639.1.p1  ORF type:complete len:243 (+),score=28.09 GHVU01182639.1:364-1092(+)
MAAAAATAADTSGGSGLQCSLEPVKAASAAYLCCVGFHCANNIPQLLKAEMQMGSAPSRIAIITDENIHRLHLNKLRRLASGMHQAFFGAGASTGATAAAAAAGTGANGVPAGPPAGGSGAPLTPSIPIVDMPLLSRDFTEEHGYVLGLVVPAGEPCKSREAKAAVEDVLLANSCSKATLLVAGVLHPPRLPARVRAGRQTGSRVARHVRAHGGASARAWYGARWVLKHAQSVGRSVVARNS